ncbi:MAG: nucleotidyltransferase family protein [Campylobacterota bacterium]|nr:nucleotidyltransferase family protein [Campylobacterota bacterium]
MQNRETILDFLRQNKQKIQENYKVNTIALFGSFARDEATKDSDIDILVDMKPSFDNFFDLKYFLEDNLDTKVDLGKEKNLRLLVKDQIQNELIYV